MQRDQRVEDNWALIYAIELALQNQKPLVVVFNLVPNFLEATFRQYDFMLKGLRFVEQKLLDLNIPFQILLGKPEENIPKFIEELQVETLVTDFNPLKIVMNWKKQVANKININICEIDASNIVPVQFVSRKMEFAAYTLRPKIHRLLFDYLIDFPKINPIPKFDIHFTINWKEIENSLKIDFSVKPIHNFLPNEEEAKKILAKFITEKLADYPEKRNNPNLAATSDLSPYIHFGQISTQRIALDVENSSISKDKKESFLEELIVRRELAENFCFYNPNYDSFEGFPQWAKESLNLHRKDEREFVYSIKQFENMQTHDRLWNAAQFEMKEKGKMHGYLRMYWAKKILEWTDSPETAMKTAIYLNDKYSLDGRDPNGYAGISWSIGGTHDRAWNERAVFGKIRFMNLGGAKRKFDVEKYISTNSDNSSKLF